MVTKRETNKREELLKLLYRAIYVLAFAFCLFKIYDYKHPYFGYTALPKFGSQFPVSYTHLTLPTNREV